MYQGKYEVQYVAQGHFSTQTGADKGQTTNLQIGRQPTLPPQPRHWSICLLLDHWLQEVTDAGQIQPSTKPR